MGYINNKTEDELVILLKNEKAGKKPSGGDF
jgi:hypothetical protein